MPLQKVDQAFKKFIKFEASGGLMLLFATIAALVVSNSVLYSDYKELLYLPFSFGYGKEPLTLSLHHWINDALMAVFFLLVALEIKREVVQGHLSERSQLGLPILGAIGGIAVPSLIFVAFNLDNTAGAMKGWAIPAATDIAFAIGLLSLLGKRVPIAAKVFLTALAIIDDLVAILIIAIFYNSGLNYEALMIVGACMALLVLFNFGKVALLMPYLFVGGVMWYYMLQSGIHATLAGVMLGFTIPINVKKDHHTFHPLNDLEHRLWPWVTFMIMPIFGFFNAGISFKNFTMEDLFDPIGLGIAAGLFLGKQFGVFGMAVLAVKSGLSKLPKDTNWMQLYGVSIFTGIGFTMSLFISNLAYATYPHVQDVSRLGIISGSLLSTIVGLIWLGILAKPTVKK